MTLTPEVVYTYPTDTAAPTTITPKSSDVLYVGNTGPAIYELHSPLHPSTPKTSRLVPGSDSLRDPEWVEFNEADGYLYVVERSSQAYLGTVYYQLDTATGSYGNFTGTANPTGVGLPWAIGNPYAGGRPEGWSFVRRSDGTWYSCDFREELWSYSAGGAFLGTHVCPASVGGDDIQLGGLEWADANRLYIAGQDRVILFDASTTTWTLIHQEDWRRWADLAIAGGRIYLCAQDANFTQTRLESIALDGTGHRVEWTGPSGTDVIGVTFSSLESALYVVDAAKGEILRFPLASKAGGWVVGGLPIASDFEPPRLYMALEGGSSSSGVGGGYGELLVVLNINTAEVVRVVEFWNSTMPSANSFGLFGGATDTETGIIYIAAFYRKAIVKLMPNDSWTLIGNAALTSAAVDAWTPDPIEGPMSVRLVDGQLWVGYGENLGMAILDLDGNLVDTFPLPQAASMWEPPSNHAHSGGLFLTTSIDNFSASPWVWESATREFLSWLPSSIGFAGSEGIDVCSDGRVVSTYLSNRGPEGCGIQVWNASGAEENLWGIRRDGQTGGSGAVNSFRDLAVDAVNMVWTGDKFGNNSSAEAVPLWRINPLTGDGRLTPFRLTDLPDRTPTDQVTPRYGIKGLWADKGPLGNFSSMIELVWDYGASGIKDPAKVAPWAVGDIYVGISDNVMSSSGGVRHVRTKEHPVSPKTESQLPGTGSIVDPEFVVKGADGNLYVGSRNDPSYGNMTTIYKFGTGGYSGQEPWMKMADWSGTQAGFGWALAENPGDGTWWMTDFGQLLWKISAAGAVVAEYVLGVGDMRPMAGIAWLNSTELFIVGGYQIYRFHLPTTTFSLIYSYPGFDIYWNDIAVANGRLYISGEVGPSPYKSVIHSMLPNGTDLRVEWKDIVSRIYPATITYAPWEDWFYVGDWENHKVWRIRISSAT